MKLTVYIPQEDINRPLINIHLIMESDGAIGDVSITRYDKEQPYFKSLEYEIAGEERRPHFHEVMDSHMYHNKLKAMRAEISNIKESEWVDPHTILARTPDQVKKMALDIIDKYIKEDTNDTN